MVVTPGAVTGLIVNMQAKERLTSCYYLKVGGLLLNSGINHRVTTNTTYALQGLGFHVFNGIYINFAQNGSISESEILPV